MRRLLATLGLVLLLVTPAVAQVAFDGEAVVAAEFSATDTWTLAAKTTAGANRVGVLALFYTTVSAPTSVEYGGNAMTSVVSEVWGTRTVRLYQYVAPPTGATSIVVGFAGSESGIAAVVSYNGVDQTTPIRAGSPNTATGTSTAPSVAITSQADDMVVDAVVISHLLSSAGGGQTERHNDDDGARSLGGSDEAGGASVTMSWTGAGSAAWAIVGASLAAVGGGPPPLHPRLLLLGIG